MNAAIRYGCMVVVAALMVGCSTASKDMRLSNKGMDQINNGEYKKAEKTLKEALEENPDNPYAVLNMGVVYHKTGRPEKARRMYEKVIEMRAADPAERATAAGVEGKPLHVIAQQNLKRLRRSGEGSSGQSGGGSGADTTG